MNYLAARVRSLLLTAGGKLLTLFLVGGWGALASPAWAADSWKAQGGQTVTSLHTPVEITWTPATSTSSPTIYTEMPMACQWNADNTQSGTGTITLTVYRCTSSSGTQANQCNQNDSGTNAITAGDSGAHFNMDPGRWMVVASATTSNGVLICDPQIIPSKL